MLHDMLHAGVADLKPHQPASAIKFMSPLLQRYAHAVTHTRMIRAANGNRQVLSALTLCTLFVLLSPAAPPLPVGLAISQVGAY